MITGTDSISVPRGDSLDVTVTVKAENTAGKPVPVNITNAVAKLSVKKKANATEYELQLDGVIDNGPLGQLSFSLPAGETDEMAPGNYLYDVQVTLPNGKVYTVLYDAFELTPDITRPEP